MKVKDFRIDEHCGKCKLPLENKIHFDKNGNLSKFGSACPLLETPFEDDDQ